MNTTKVTAMNRYKNEIAIGDWVYNTTTPRRQDNYEVSLQHWPHWYIDCRHDGREGGAYLTAVGWEGDSTEGLSGQQVKSNSVRNSLIKHRLNLIRMSNTMDSRGVGRFVDSRMRRATVNDGNSICLVNDKNRTQYVFKEWVKNGDWKKF